MRTEWLLTNGLGGFAMGTVAGVPTRRYHALLIGATTPPVGRVCALHSIVEQLSFEERGESGAETRGAVIDLSTFEFRQTEGKPNLLHPRGVDRLQACNVSETAVSWTYECHGVRVLKRLELGDGSNACRVTYEIDADADHRRRHPRVRLVVRPLVALHDFHQLYRNDWYHAISHSSDQHAVTISHDRYRLAIRSAQASFRHDPQWWYGLEHRAEADRRQDSLRDLHSPGVFTWVGEWPSDGKLRILLSADLCAGDEVLATPDPAGTGSSTQPRTDAVSAGSGSDDTRVWGDLVAAARAFVVRRVERASGGRGRQSRGVSIIAGYPWFSDWGRDTFISLPGLLLCTRRFDEARQTLETFALARRNGLIPNVYNDQTGEAEYNTVDGSLWYLHAACEYVERSGDVGVLRWQDDARGDAGSGRTGGEIGRACLDIVAQYRRGTDHQIGMDPFDKLIAAGSETSQLTWMDARRDGVTFTPRHGKPVEVNALWCSGLVRLAALVSSLDATTGANLRDLGVAAGRSFARLYWNDRTGCLRDCLSPPREHGERDWGTGPGHEGAGEEIRPNQLFALSLPHCPLGKAQQASVLRQVEERLLTPMGVRTLDPSDSRYRGRYEGSLFERDAAYHQGTAWPYLLGVYAMAVMRAGDGSVEARTKARAALAPIIAEMDARGPAGGCPGFIAEVYDGDAPQRPGGCPAQAWSIATICQAWEMITGA